MQGSRLSTPVTTLQALVVIAVVLVVAYVVMAPSGGHICRSVQTECMNNLNQLGKACEMYQTEWGDVLVPYGAPFHRPPKGRMWPDLLIPYLREMEGRGAKAGRIAKCFRCPQDPDKETDLAYDQSYGMNTCCGGWMPGETPVVISTSKAKYPSQTIRLAETEWKARGGSLLSARPGDYDPKDPECHRFAIRHNDTGNILWIDGHVSSMNMERYIYAGDTSAAERANPDKAVWHRLKGPKYQP